MWTEESNRTWDDKAEVEGSLLPHFSDVGREACKEGKGLSQLIEDARSLISQGRAISHCKFFSFLAS